MAKNIITTNELTGVRVVGGKSGNRRIGKLRYFVFHPSEKRIVGFIVKRPDFLWMFRRKNKFVSINGYDLIDGRVVVRNEPEATDRAAYKTLGLNPDECVLWLGLPIMTEDKKSFGVVGNVIFNQITGLVRSIESDAGMTANALLGKRDIPAKMIRGFHIGMGVALSATEQESNEYDETKYGALLVSNEVLAVAAEGGVAEKAGKATAVIADKAGKATATASKHATAALKKTGKAVNKGAYATGKQIGKTKGMFSAFKDEYNKARHDEE